MNNKKVWVVFVQSTHRAPRPIEWVNNLTKAFVFASDKHHIKLRGIKRMPNHRRDLVLATADGREIVFTERVLSSDKDLRATKEWLEKYSGRQDWSFYNTLISRIGVKISNSFFGRVIVVLEDSNDMTPRILIRKYLDGIGVPYLLISDGRTLVRDRTQDIALEQVKKISEFGKKNLKKDTLWRAGNFLTSRYATRKQREDWQILGKLLASTSVLFEVSRNFSA